MKKSLSFLLAFLIIITAFVPVTVKAADTFITPKNAVFTERTASDNVNYYLSFTANEAVAYEKARIKIYNEYKAEAKAKFGDKYTDSQIDDLLALTENAWALYPLVFTLSVKTNGGEQIISVINVNTNTNSLSVSLFGDIIPALLKNFDFADICDGFDFTLVLAPALNINGNYSGSENFGNVESGTYTAPAFSMIEYDTPEDTNLNGNPKFVFAPIENDIVLNLPTLSGFTFTSFTDSEGKSTDRVKAGTRYTKISINWKVKTFRLRTVLTTRSGYDFIKCPSNNPTEFTPDEDLILADPKVPNGWVFSGWYLNADFSGSPITVIPKGTEKDVVIYAKWQTEQEVIDEKIAKEHWGDLDTDGKITSADARLTLRSAVGLENFPSEIIQRADFADKGRLSAADARHILRISVGIETMEGILRDYGRL